MSQEQFNKKNFTNYKEGYQYKQYQDGDGIQSSLYDITMNGNIKPDNKNQAVLVVDSAERDHKKYPDPNKYSLDLNYVYKDVTMVELKFANIPNSAYIINESNNKLHFQDSMEQVHLREYNEIYIPIGNWTADSTTGPSIRSNLEDALNSVNSSNKYSVIFNPNLRKFTIEQVSGSGVFNLIFCTRVRKTGQGGTITKMIQGVDRFCYPEVPVQDYERVYIEGTIGRVLGFNPINLAGSTSYTSQKVADLNTGRYVVLKIRNLERVNSNNSRIDGAFCVIGMDDSINNFVLNRGFDYFNNETYTKNFNPPLPEFSKLDIEILNCNGDPYEFNGRDHLLVFDILSLSRYDNY